MVHRIGHQESLLMGPLSRIYVYIYIYDILLSLGLQLPPEKVVRVGLGGLTTF